MVLYLVYDGGDRQLSLRDCGEDALAIGIGIVYDYIILVVFNS